MLKIITNVIGWSMIICPYIWLLNLIITNYKCNGFIQEDFLGILGDLWIMTQLIGYGVLAHWLITR